MKLYRTLESDSSIEPVPVTEPNTAGTNISQLQLFKFPSFPSSRKQFDKRFKNYTTARNYGFCLVAMAEDQ